MKPIRLAALIIAMLLFFIGWHNIDNAHNMKTVNSLFRENDINITLVDWSVAMSFSENQLHIQGTVVMFFSLLIFAMIITDYESEKYGKRKARRKSNTRTNTHKKANA